MPLVVTWCKCESMDKLVKSEAFIDYIRIKGDKFCDNKLDLNIGSFGFQVIATLWILGGPRVIFLALVQSFSHYNIVAQKVVRNYYNNYHKYILIIII